MLILSIIVVLSSCCCAPVIYLMSFFGHLDSNFRYSSSSPSSLFISLFDMIKPLQQVKNGMNTAIGVRESIAHPAGQGLITIQ